MATASNAARVVAFGSACVLVACATPAPAPRAPLAVAPTATARKAPAPTTADASRVDPNRWRVVTGLAAAFVAEGYHGGGQLFELIAQNGPDDLTQDEVTSAIDHALAPSWKQLWAAANETAPPAAIDCRFAAGTFADPGTCYVDVHTSTPGAEPRRRLRYTWVAGASSESELRQGYTRDCVEGDCRRMLTLRYRVAAQVVSVSKHGVALVRYAIKSAESLPCDLPWLAAEADPAVRTLTALTAEATLDDRGRLLAFETYLPGGQKHPAAAFAHDVARRLAHWVVPLPEEPIGVGASYLVSRRGGEQTFEQRRYDVAAIEASRVQLLVGGLEVFTRGELQEPWREAERTKLGLPTHDGRYTTTFVHVLYGSADAELSSLRSAAQLTIVRDGYVKVRKPDALSGASADDLADTPWFRRKLEDSVNYEQLGSEEPR